MGGLMPEAPELAIVREVLERRIIGATVESSRVIRPTVLRTLSEIDVAADIEGRTFTGISRYGKSVTLSLSGEMALVIFPMLTGRLRLSAPKDRVTKTVCLALSLSNGVELRYADDRQMGMLYYAPTDRLTEIPRLEETGPDVLDEPLSLDDFAGRLRRFTGEIKGILTRGALVAGIGNAYSDEIVWEAGISPFRRRADLSTDEIARLHSAVYAVPRHAVVMLRELMGDEIHRERREWLSVHGKADQECPRCCGRISRLSANRRITDYCMRCQPGLLIPN